MNIAVYSVDRLHEYNDTASGNPGETDRPSILLSTLAMDAAVGNKSFVQSFSNPLGSLNVTIRSANDRNAMVSVCRFLRNTETGNLCQDGLDNDWCVGRMRRGSMNESPLQ